MIVFILLKKRTGELCATWPVGGCQAELQILQIPSGEARWNCSRPNNHRLLCASSLRLLVGEDGQAAGILLAPGLASHSGRRGMIVKGSRRCILQLRGGSSPFATSTSMVRAARSPTELEQTSSSIPSSVSWKCSRPSSTAVDRSSSRARERGSFFNREHQSLITAYLTAPVRILSAGYHQKPLGFEGDLYAFLHYLRPSAM